MGVDVDESRRDEATVRVDRLPRFAVDLADLGDHAVGHGHVPGEGFLLPGSVDDLSVANDEVVHGWLLLVAAPGRGRTRRETEEILAGRTAGVDRVIFHDALAGGRVGKGARRRQRGLSDRDLRDAELENEEKGHPRDEPDPSGRSSRA